MTTPTLDMDRIFRRFGDAPGLHARLVQSPYTPVKFPPSTVRAWKTRGGFPGGMILTILLLLRDAGEDPFSYVREPPEPDDNPLEGLLDGLPTKSSPERGDHSAS